MPQIAGRLTMKPKSADELRDQQDIADIKALLKSEANTPLNTQNAELDAPDAADIAAKRRSQRELADLVCTDSHRGFALQQCGCRKK
jgi:hypothetical protein